MKTKIKKVKKLTVTKVKKQAWDAFSVWIRTKDSFDGNNECFTCEFIFPIKKLQAGHFVPGRHNSVLFDERNCHPQCYRCNVLLKGNLIEYYPKMERLYGSAVIEDLKTVDSKPRQFKVYALEEIRDYYKSQLEELNIENSSVKNYDKSMVNEYKKKGS